MHMADALITPAVGGTMWAASAGLVAWCSRKMRAEKDEGKVPLMGVGAAFVFAAQMINFAVPGTGSSGHLGGGLLLAIMLGPHAAFLTMVSILTVQALFFADGGLLALGCNIFNLGFFPCLVAYPLIFRPLAGGSPARGRTLVAAFTAAVIGLQLGSLAVVVQTTASGLTELSAGPFLLLMQPIHLAIGIVEGAATAAVVLFVRRVRPELWTAAEGPLRSPATLLAGLLLVAALTGGALSWFASTEPDGLEWALFHAGGEEEPVLPESSAHQTLARLQDETALLPDYDYAAPAVAPEVEDSQWPAVNPGTTAAGLVGALLTLLAAGAVGFAVRYRGTSR